MTKKNGHVNILGRQIDMSPIINYEGTPDQFWSALFIAVVRKYMTTLEFTITEKRIVGSIVWKI